MIHNPLSQMPLLEKSSNQEVKILLVDDRPENLISLESLLEKEDKDVRYLYAHSGEQALKIALKEELALILLDVQMPHMNGYEVARYLRNTSRTRNIPIIFVTAIDENISHMQEGFEVGAVDFLFKPLHPYITRAKVSAFIRFYRQKKELERANAYILQMNRDLEARVEERTRELTKINTELDNFIYIASHDLKAPIHNIEGLMSLLEKALSADCPDARRVAAIQEMINESVNRFKKTVLDLTAVAQVNYEEQEDQELLNLAELMKEVKVDINNLIQEADAHLQEDFSQAPELTFSRKNLRSILYNLSSNAIKYRSPERKPEVKLSSCWQNGYFCLSVEDNGLGIRQEDQQKLYQMFKRLHSHVEGAGIGMAIVKRIVDNAGGKIEIDSEPGRGTRFTVFLKQSL